VFDLVAFDADDTLWHSETFYYEAQGKFAKLLLAYQPDEEKTLEVLHQAELQNLTSFGYGVKGFVFSMLEAALQISQQALTGRETQRILDLGHWMLSHEISLIEHVAEVVEEIARNHRMIIITKGDLIDQERKFQQSGLVHYFQAIEVVSNKTPEVYRALMERHRVEPQHFLMIGNSLKSDILPVLECGGYGVFVPYSITWAHEVGDPPNEGHERYFEIEHLGKLPELIRQIEKNS
jgi:putative hydrolase of the HAD superfamily